MVVIVEKNKKGKIELTQEELQRIIKEAEQAGKDSVQLVPYYYPDYTPYYHYVDYWRPGAWWEYQPTCTGTDPNHPYRVNASPNTTSINSKDYKCNGTETTAHFASTFRTETEVKADNE